MKSLTSFALLSLACTANAALKYVGVDWSSVKVEEKSGVSYTTTSGQRQPLEKILADNGVDTVRQRIWVNPSNGEYNLNYNLELAKRAKAQGLNVYLDLHYSDTWADPSKQGIPKGWPQDIDNLAWKVYNYTLEVSNAFAAAGINPSIISVGNEIRNGLLWPTGKTNNPGNIARLLHSGSSGIKDSKLTPKPKIMLHLDNGWDSSAQQSFYNAVLGAGPLSLSDFDMMGVSFYPFYNEKATLANLKSSLTNMANKWNKELVVAELNWPVSCPSPSNKFPSDMQNIPFSASGQVQFIKKVASIVSGVKNGVGLFYWEPAWIDNAGLGSSCASNTMFEWPGKALSSLSVFGQI